MAEIEEVGNQTHVLAVGNQIEITLLDVFTDRYFSSQFQVTEEHKEVTNASIN